MTLKLLIKDAVFVYDLDVFSKMDPYVVLTIGENKQRTATCKEGGKTPQWNQTITFSLGAGDTAMKLEAWDQDPIHDDFIGETTVNLTKFKSILSQTMTQQVEVYNKAEKVGRVTITFQYAPPSN